MADVEAAATDLVAKPVTPVTVFTGFVGAGKTTLILSLMKKLPKDYKICLLKNEFGDAQTDSELARESNVDVAEMVNGCICCVLVGQMKSALIEMKEKYNPDRIVIETSGSAFPGPIAWQIRQLKEDGFSLDAIVTVIDCENFSGYEDTSYTARIQAQYTDVILLNKHDLVSERALDLVIDRVNDLNVDTPKVYCDKINGVDPNLIFGLDTRLFSVLTAESSNPEIPSPSASSCHDPDCADPEHAKNGSDITVTHHHDRELDLISITRHIEDSVNRDRKPIISETDFRAVLDGLSKDTVYRVKGLARLLVSDDDRDLSLSGGPALTRSNDRLFIVNWAFGRLSLVPVTKSPEGVPERDAVHFKLTVMGIDLFEAQPSLRKGLCLDDDEIDLRRRLNR